MKETTKMSRAVGQLEKMYNTINADLTAIRGERRKNMKKSRLYNMTIRCYYGEQDYTMHRQELKLTEIEKWIKAYRFTHPNVKSFSIQITIKEERYEDKPHDGGTQACLHE